MADAPESKRRVLYIDDDRDLRRLVELSLGRSGYHVTLASSGADGIQALLDGAFDVVALDHYMPGQDGLATLAQIVLLPDAPPVIYVTATDERRISAAAREAGAVDCVIKSVSGFLSLLRNAIDAAVAGVELRRRTDAVALE
jgi:CheY-like chemotaxis protein